MTYQVPASKASIGQNRFEFAFPTGTKKKFSVPLLKYLKPSVAEQLTGKALTDGVKVILEVGGCPDAFDRFDTLEQMQDWWAAYQEASNVTVGESSASSDS